MSHIVEISPDALRLSLYGDNSNYMRGYLNRQLQSMSSGQSHNDPFFFNLINNSLNRINNSLLNYEIHNELNNLGMRAVDDYFSYISSFVGLQEANVTMQRWIMAHPEVKKQFLEQRIDGYSNTYINISGDTYGEEDYDFRRVNNGIMREDPLTGEDYFVEYHEDLIEGDRELNAREQFDILNSWATIDNMLKSSDYDFTNPSPTPQKRDI